MPPKASGIAGQEQKNVLKAERKKRKRRKKNNNNFSCYIYRVLKQIHPDAGISSQAMVTMNNFVIDIFERIAAESCRLVRNNKGKTLTSREIHTAVRLLLPGELAKHAVSEGTKAVSKFMGNPSTTDVIASPLQS